MNSNRSITLALFATGLTAVVSQVALGQEVALYPVGTLAETSGELVAWGDNSEGQLNLPTTNIESVDAAGQKSVAVLRVPGSANDRSIRTAGLPLSGDPFGQNLPPGSEGQFFNAVSLGENFATGPRDIFGRVGPLTAWGDNFYGQLNKPAGDFRAVAAGSNHSIGLREDGTLAGWGWNFFGQTQVPSGTYDAVAAAFVYSMAIATDGTLRTWGLPGPTSLPGPFTGLAAGPNLGLGIRADGSLEAVFGSSPAALPTGAFSAAAAGPSHALAIRDDGSLVGWGGNSFGQINVPKGVFTAVAAGENHSLALRARTNYDRDLKVSYTGPATGANGLKANLNRNVTVARDALIESPLNFFNSATLNVAGKVTFQGQANFSGAGTILSTGGGMEFSQSSPTFIPAGVELLNLGPLLGAGQIQLAGGTLTTGFGPFGVTTGAIVVNDGGRLNFVGRGAAQPEALFVDPGAVVTLTAGQGLRTPGNLRLSGELRLNGNRGEFAGGAELSAGGTTPGGGANLTVTDTGVLEFDDATLSFPGGANLQFGSQVRVLGGTNEISGSLQAAGRIECLSGFHAFRGPVSNYGEVHLLNDTIAAFYSDIDQYGELVIGDPLAAGAPSIAQANFRGAYRGLGASGGGDLTFHNYLSPQSLTTSAAVAAFDNNVALGRDARLVLRLRDGPEANLSSRLNVTRLLRLEGALEVYDLGAESLGIGTSFDLLDWGSLVGQFSSIVLPELDAGLDWDLTSLYSTGEILVAAAPALAGDYNGDGAVDMADYTVWRDGGSPDSTPTGYDLWAANHGATATATGAAVPEPASAALLIAALQQARSRRRSG